MKTQKENPERETEMKKLLTITFLALIGVLLLPGCTATKIEYSQNDKGETSYSIWHNGHWLKTEAERMSGGMSKNGQFSVDLSGLKSSPSEEFNRTMQTYMGAFIQLAQIAAAAYNPSASAALQNVSANQSAAAKSASATTTPAAAATITPAISVQEDSASAACADGSCSPTNATECADCTVK